MVPLPTVGISSKSTISSLVCVWPTTETAVLALPPTSETNKVLLSIDRAPRAEPSA